MDFQLSSLQRERILEIDLERIRPSRFDGAMNAPASDMIPRIATTMIEVNGTPVIADLSGAVFLQDERALLVADLHLEKGSSFAGKGIFLPPYDTRATLRTLSDAIHRLQPRTVIALGDSFHDLGADRRMARADIDTLSALVRSVPDWIWIEGNHDPAPPPQFGGSVMPKLEISGLTLRHEPQPGTQPGEVGGHLHPCAKVRANGRTVRKRCFVSDGQRLILPSFGAFTGGLNVRDEAYEGLFQSRPDVWMLGRDRIYRVSGRKVLAD